MAEDLEFRYKGNRWSFAVECDRRPVLKTIQETPDAVVIYRGLKTVE